jgi:hypothetical protein
MTIMNATRAAIVGVLDGLWQPNTVFGAKTKGYNAKQQGKDLVRDLKIATPELEKRGWEIINGQTPSKYQYYVQWLPPMGEGEPTKFILYDQNDRKVVLEGDLKDPKKAVLAINKAAKKKEFWSDKR